METALLDLRREVEGVASESSSERTSEEQEEKLLLSKTSGKLIADCADIPELAIEIERAVWQVERSMKAKQELREEKEEMDAANMRNSKQ